MLWIEIETCLTFFDLKLVVPVFTIIVFRILVVVVVVYFGASLDSVF